MSDRGATRVYLIGGYKNMIITQRSHLDHGLTPAHIAFIEKRFAEREDSFFLETVELPSELDALPCALVGPLTEGAPVGEALVKYVVRGDRRCASRVLVKAVKPPRSRLLTVIGGWMEEDGGPCELYTAYGGPCAPREPGDPDIATYEDLIASRAFWRQHALIVDLLSDESYKP